MVNEDEFPASLLLLPLPDTVAVWLGHLPRIVQLHVAHRSCLTQKRAYPYAATADGDEGETVAWALASMAATKTVSLKNFDQFFG
jgi:hypothetical protein